MATTPPPPPSATAIWVADHETLSSVLSLGAIDRMRMKNEGQVALMDRVGYDTQMAAAGDWPVEKLEQEIFKHVEWLVERARKKERTQIAKAVIWNGSEVKIRCRCTPEARSGGRMTGSGHVESCPVHFLLDEGETEDEAT